MTAPTPEGADAGQSGGSGKKRTAPEPLQVLDVVVYTHRDPILRREHRGLGVVAEVSDQAVIVRPVADHELTVDPADVTRYTDTGS